MKDNGGSGGINERQVYANACDELYPINQNTFDCPYGSAVCEPSKNLSYGMASNSWSFFKNNCIFRNLLQVF